MENHNRKLKVLFISKDKFPPFRVDVAVLFGKELSNRGHRIDWVLQSDQDCKKGYKIPWGGGNVWVGATNNRENLIGRVAKHILGFFHSCRCVKLLRKATYDYIQIKDRFITAIIYLIAGRILKIKTCYWLSYPFGDASIYESKARIARYPAIYLVRGMIYNFLLYRIILRMSDHVFVQSEQMKKDILSAGIKRKYLTVIPMGFEKEKFKKQNIGHDIYNIDFGSHCIAYLGTLARVRHIDFLIRVLKKVQFTILTARLILIGKGETAEDEQVLKNEAKRLEVEKSVIFTGYIERSKAIGVIKKADVCVSPFYPTPILNSTSPTKLIEYMALGKPVVANEHPEQKLVIEESGGGLCVPYDENEFAKAIVTLMKNPEIRREMGKKGKKWVNLNRTYGCIADIVEYEYFNISNKRKTQHASEKY